jgi:hypothetical protein
MDVKTLGTNMKEDGKDTMQPTGVIVIVTMLSLGQGWERALNCSRREGTRDHDRGWQRLRLRLRLQQLRTRT